MESDKNFDVNRFNKIDLWSKDNYTNTTNVRYGNNKFHIGIKEGDVEIRGDMKIGSYISVDKDDKFKITSITIIPAALFNKIKQEQSLER